MAFGGYGKQLKNDYRRLYGATVNFAGRGEMIPNADSYCEIDPAVVDQWGIPVLRFHFKWSDYEYKQVKHMQETFRAIITEMGGVPSSKMPTAEEGYGIEPGGRIIHEVGRYAHGQRSVDVGPEQVPARHTTRRTCSSPTLDRWCRRRTRTAPGRSWRWRCGRRSTSRSSGRRGRSSGQLPLPLPATRCQQAADRLRAEEK